MSSIKLKHSGGNSVSLNPPTSAPTSSDVAFKLPNADGSANQLLKTDGSGNLGWATDQGGKILQVVSTTKTAVASQSIGAGSVWPYNDSSLRATITASSASNFFRITGQIVTGSNGLAVSVMLNDNGSQVTATGALGDASGITNRSFSGTGNGSTEGVSTIPVHIYIPCVDTNQHIFHYTFWHNGGGTNTVYLNRPYSGTNSTARGRYISNITVEEISA